MFNRLFARHFSSQYNTSVIKSIFDKKTLDKYICVKGWVKSIRRMKVATFIDIYDGSSSKKLQVVVPREHDVSGICFHCGVSVTGIMKASSHPKQEFELHADTVELVGSMDGSGQSYPFAARHSHPPDYVRQYQHIRARTDKFAATLRVRQQARTAINSHFLDADFIQVDTPVITSNECEGAGNVFLLQSATEKANKDALYYDKEVYLSVSAQMHLEAMANGLSRVYSFNPAFRAEAFMGRRHLAEFWMVEAEEAFLQGEAGLAAVLDRVEALVKDTLSCVLNRCSDDVRLHWEDDPNREPMVQQVISSPFTRMTYAEAVTLLSAAPESNTKVAAPPDSAATTPRDSSALTTEHELRLTELVGGAVFVTHWPTAAKPFYMALSEATPDTVLGMDLLLPEVGEVAGGSVREASLESLQKRLPASQNLEWYLQLRSWGGVPTAGYGLGFERLLMFLLGVQNARDVIPFPRWPRHCEH